MSEDNPAKPNSTPTRSVVSVATANNEECDKKDVATNIPGPVVDTTTDRGASGDDRNQPQQDKDDEDSVEKNSDEKKTEDKKQRVFLLDLPSEILLHICSFLDAEFIVDVFAKVCRSLKIITDDVVFWKVRMGWRWPGYKYPIIPVVSSEFCWKDACLLREKSHRIWSCPEEGCFTDHYVFSAGRFAPVDTIHLFKEGRFLASGSRDRYLNLLDLSKVSKESEENSKCDSEVFSKMNAHKGWIWSVKSFDNSLVSCSWDCHVKLWDIGGATAEEYRSVKCSSALLCSYVENNFMAVGAYNKKVHHIDPRTGDIVASFGYHKASVLTMEGNDRHIITGSEDGTLSIFDRRAQKTLTTIQLEEYPMSLSLSPDYLWCGDKKGNLHLIDPADFTLFETFPDSHENKVTGIAHNQGIVFTSSTDKTVKIWQPTTPLSLISTLHSHSMDVVDVSYQNGILATGSSDITVQVWIPKDHKFTNM